MNNLALAQFYHLTTIFLLSCNRQIGQSRLAFEFKNSNFACEYSIASDAFKMLSYGLLLFYFVLHLALALSILLSLSLLVHCAISYRRWHMAALRPESDPTTRLPIRLSSDAGSTKLQAKIIPKSSAELQPISRQGDVCQRNRKGESARRIAKRSSPRRITKKNCQRESPKSGWPSCLSANKAKTSLFIVFWIINFFISPILHHHYSLGLIPLARPVSVG